MTGILDTIDSPADLRKLSLEQLDKLAEEIRQEIISVTAANGGHLAPNLGVVELTIAIHYAFDTPADKLIWDVGHQCYAHKLLTGRREQFATLRQYGGISGFCSRKESFYDCFTTGHCSNSLSLALGMAVARDLNGEKNNVIAVIGDGALSGGMSFEALNNAGALKSPLLVILNDNKMSINKNVGALNTYLAHLRSDPKYSRAKKNVHAVLDHIPLLGKFLAGLISRLKNKIKYMLVPGMYFEDLGFTYLGPTDGHDIKNMVEIFKSAASIKKPVMIHVMTTKGKGYMPAEQSPRFWHGVDPFDIASGKRKSCSQGESYTSVFGRTIAQIAADDKDIVAITAAMTDGTGLTEFKQKYPERFFDVGIAEQHAASFAAGLANAGKRPVLAVYSSFLQRAYDQIIEDICLQQLPVVLAVDRAGIVGSDGCTHQGVFDIAYLRNIPGLTLMAPASTKELQAMLRYALAQDSPVAIRYPRGDSALSPAVVAPLEKGKAEILTEGNDLCIFALGSMVEVACNAGEILAESGISTRVVNARFASPIDGEMLKLSARQCKGRIVTIEDGIIQGGFGEGCLDILADTNAQLLICGIPGQFVPHGCRRELLKMLGLDSQQIAEKIKKKWFGNQ